MSPARNEFEHEVITGLTELKTKMNILVGVDGNGGWKDDIETRMRAQEHRGRRRSFRITGFTSIASALGGGIAAWLVRHFWPH